MPLKVFADSRSPARISRIPCGRRIFRERNASKQLGVVLAIIMGAAFSGVILWGLSS